MLCLKPQKLAVFSRLSYPIEEEGVCGKQAIYYEIQLKIFKVKPNQTKPKEVYLSGVVLSFYSPSSLEAASLQYYTVFVH